MKLSLEYGKKNFIISTYTIENFTPISTSSGILHGKRISLEMAISHCLETLGPVLHLSTFISR